MAVCWKCRKAEYHNYKDKHGIRCPLCGQKQSDDPARQPVVRETETKRPSVRRK